MAPDAALGGAIGGAYTDDFVNCDGRTFPVDVNRDGATDLLFASGALCSGATENTHGVLWGVPGGSPGLVDSSALPASLDATAMAEAQFVDIDADGYLDLLRPDPAGSGYTLWLRNDGDDTPFDGVDQVLDIPIEDSTSASASEVADSQAACLVETGDLFWWPDTIGTEHFEFDSAEDYVHSMARWGDYNGDGVTDVAYSFWSCWDGADPAAGFLHSYLFYGDGQGSFEEAPTGVGPPGWVVRSLGGYETTSEVLDGYVVNGVADLDRSGRPELLHCPELYGEGGGGNLPLLTASMGIGAPALFGYGAPPVGFDEECPHAVCEDTTLPVQYLSYSANGASVSNAVTDWDGDAFPDIVDVRAGANVSIAWYENYRANARHRITRIHEAWGGVTQLTWASSALEGANDGLPYAVEVIESVDGEDGLTRFGFEGGYSHEGRFSGFGEAWIQYESGRTASVRFAQSLPFAGDLVSRTEYRADGSIETFTFVSPLGFEIGSGSITLDGQPPYFNPTRRRCEYHVGPGYAYGGTVLQSVDEEELVALCVQFGDGPDFWAEQWTTALGWQRASADTADIRDAVWADDVVSEYAFAGEAGPKGAWPGPTWSLPERLGYPGMATDVPGDLPVPTAPPIPVMVGAGTTEVDMYATGWEYTPDQRVSDVHEWRDVSTTADDIHQEHTRDPYVTPAHGEQLTATEWTDASGSVLREVVRADFEAFDLPRIVSERGATGAARYWYYTFASGEVLTLRDPDLALTTYTRNRCGQPTKKIDPVGREEEWEYSTACREESWSWEGASRTTTYDALGRAYETIVDAGIGSSTAPAVTERWFRDDDLDVTDFVATWIANPGDRASWDEPRAAVVRDDTLRLLYLDRWGRQALEVRCEDGPGIASSVSAILVEHACVAGTEVYQYTGYAEDGTLRVETMPWASGEVPAGTYGYRDVFGRVEELFAPAPAEVTSAFDAYWVQSSFTYEPGRVDVKDPVGRSCSALSDTMGGERWCEGAFRGSYERDVMGNVVEEVDGAGVATAYTYDPFRRLETRSLPGGVELHDGTVVTPTWTLGWSSGGRLENVEDPGGNVRSWWYDSAGRVTSAWFDPVSEPAELVGTWSWQDHAGTPGSRRVVSTDVNGYPSSEWQDGLGRTWKRVHPDGTDEQWSWDAGGELSGYADIDRRLTSYTRLATGEVVTETVVGTGAVRDWEYDGAGRPVSATDRDGVETAYGWTWDGHPAWEERGGWTTASWLWRDDGRLVERAEGGVTTTYGYDGLGRRTSACVGAEAGSCGIELGWRWTARDELSAETRGVPGEPVWETKYTRNGLGWVTEVEHPDLTTEEWGYDILGRVRWHDDEYPRRSQWTWDDWGRPLTEDLPGQGVREFTYTFGSLSPEVHEVLEPDGGLWTTSYDFAGRAIAETYPDGTGLRREYDGSQLLEVWHEAGGSDLAVESLEYDALGRMSARWGPVDAGVYTRGAWTGGVDYVFEYGWTDEGRLLSVSGPKDETYFTWGTDGLLDSEEVVGVATHTYAYDDPTYPRVTGITTSSSTASRTVTKEWERGLWLASETATQGGESLVKAFGNWDAYGTPRAATSLHGPTGGETTLVAYDMTTDARGRMQTVQVGLDSGWTGVVTYGWEDDGAIDTVLTTWAGGLEYSYAPATGWLTGIADSAGSPLATFPMSERDALGRPGWVNLANGGHIEAAWDQNGRVSSWTVENQAGVSETRDYLYDGRGRLEVLDITRAAGTRTDTYTYEEPGWLAMEDRVEGTWSESVQYDYDAAGNRSRRIVDGMPEPLNTYGTGNVLTAVGTDVVTWDGLGGITADHRGYQWERYPDGSELALLETSGATIHHITRDAFGRPVAVDDGVSADAYTTIWGNPGGDWPLAGKDENGDPVLWVAAEGILVGQLRDGVATEAASGPDGSLLLLDTQFLGSPGAWGDETGAHPVGPGATERYVYAGLQSLPGTPFALARQRAYDPTMGRFTSADPIGLAGGDNRFGYANGDPLGFVDPEGLAAADFSTGVWREDKSGRGIGATDWRELSKPLNNQSPTATGEPDGSMARADAEAGLEESDNSDAVADVTAESNPAKKRTVWHVIRSWVDKSGGLHVQGHKEEVLTVQAPKDKPAGGGFGAWLKRAANDFGKAVSSLFSGKGGGEAPSEEYLRDLGFSKDPRIREVQESQAAATIAGATTVTRYTADTFTDAAVLIARMNPSSSRYYTLQALAHYERGRDQVTDAALLEASRLDDDAAAAAILTAGTAMVFVDALNPAPGGGDAKLAEAAVEAGARQADETAEVAVKLIDDLEEASERGKRFFRGAKPGQAPDFTPRPNEFKVDPATGTVKPTHGVSVFDNPESVSSKGFVPHEVDQATVPGSLRINQRGADPGHYEIMPAEGASLTPEQFSTACQGIGCKR